MRFGAAPWVLAFSLCVAATAARRGSKSPDSIIPSTESGAFEPVYKLIAGTGTTPAAVTTPACTSP